MLVVVLRRVHVELMAELLQLLEQILALLRSEWATVEAFDEAEQEAAFAVARFVLRFR